MSTIYQKLLLKQNYQCKICHSKIPNTDLSQKRFVLDHDGKTNKIRGLLCSECDAGLGCFRDSITFLQNAITYLQNG